jgi:hypothetical protein
LTLRHQSGELIEVGIGDLFDFREGTFEVVTPDTRASQQIGRPLMCCRLVRGEYKEPLTARVRKIEEDGRAPLVQFEYSLLAACIHAGRPAEAPEEEKPQPQPKAGRGKPGRPSPANAMLW